MNQKEWLGKYFEKVANSSEEGQVAVMFVKQNQVEVGLKRARKNVGAFWKLNHKFFLNTFYYSKESSLENPRAWTLPLYPIDKEIKFLITRKN